MRCKRSFTLAVVFSAILVVGCMSPGNTEEWVYLGESVKGKHYYDRASVKKTKTTVIVREKTVYSEEGKRGAAEFLAETGPYKGEALDHLLTESEFDCKASRGRTLSMAIYDRNGKRVAGSPGGATGWSEIVPDSLYDRLSRQVCR